MAKIDDEKQAKIFWKKIIIFILMAVSWWFVSGKISELYYFIYKDEIVFKQDSLILSVRDIRLPGTDDSIANHLEPWYRDRDRVSLIQKVDSNYDAKSIIAYYRKELLANGWSDLVYQKNINKSTEEHLSNIYSARKGEVSIQFSFSTLLKNPENIYGNFDGLKKSSYTTEYRIRVAPIDKNKW